MPEVALALAGDHPLREPHRMRAYRDVQGLGNALEVLAATLAQPNLPPHPFIGDLRKEVGGVGEQRPCSRKAHGFYTRDKRFVPRPAPISVDVAIRLDLPQIVGFRTLRHEHRRCDWSAGLSRLLHGDEFHVLPTIGQLIETHSLRCWQIDLEVEAGGAHRQLCVSRRNLLPRTFDGLFDRLHQGGGVRCAIARRQRRWLDALVWPPIRFTDAVIKEVDVGTVARKVVCHYNLCCR
ncbi:hypothetical protein [Hoeflea sp. 108]|uniref:hypothetical protein n=1 Tax=Hoeflea sp. 108 TaxID=1116369 RepID=UPI00058EE5F9|nr:hypothetical protein [Hoeflea sp. 108]